MGKCKDLSKFGKGQIVLARRLGQSISKTVALVGSSQCAYQYLPKLVQGRRSGEPVTVSLMREGTKAGLIQ